MSDSGWRRSDDAFERIRKWRTELLKLSEGSLHGIDETDFLGRELRAAAVVAGMAELEALLRDFLVEVGEHISSRNVKLCDLVPSLRPLATYHKFESVASLSDNEKRWTGRMEISSLDNSTNLAEFPKRQTKGPQPPLDGRTIQNRDLTLVWRVLGSKFEPYSASLANSLLKMRSLRNDIAHRNEDISGVFSQKGFRAEDIARYLDDLATLCVEIGTFWDEYLNGELYLARR